MLHIKISVTLSNEFMRYSNVPYSKAHGANMGPTWALSAPDGPHIGPRNLAIWGVCLTVMDQSLHKYEWNGHLIVVITEMVELLQQVGHANVHANCG